MRYIFFCRKLRDAASNRQLHFNVIEVANWQQGHKQPLQLLQGQLPAVTDLSFIALMFYDHLYQSG